MTPHDYQIKYAKHGAAVVRKYMMFYLAWEERTRKTLTSILICEELRVSKILVLTKKKALSGWTKTLNEFEHTKQYTATTYTQLHKLKDNDFDLVILDEAHNYISSFPAVSETWQKVKRFTRDRPLIFISATPYAQGYQQLYNQFALSSWNPWGIWKDALDWFETFGIPHKIWVAGMKRETYTKVKAECFEYVKHLFHTKKRSELGFEQEPEDRVHEVELRGATKQVYNELTKHRAITLNGYELVCDSIMKLRTTLHSIEGGTFIVSAKEGIGKKAKIVKNYIQLGNTEKVDYIKEHWGDSDDVVIMYNYIAERTKLEQHFKNATILQATSNAEGVELSHMKHLIIYSQDFSTARHIQRRARQASRDRDSEIVVHFLLVTKAISSQVYKTVSINKENYTDRLYSKELL